LRGGGQDGSSGSIRLTVVGVSLAGIGGQCLCDGAALAQAGAFKFEAMGAVDDAIQNGIAQSHVADDLVPAGYGNLGASMRKKQTASAANLTDATAG